MAGPEAPRPFRATRCANQRGQPIFASIPASTSGACPASHRSGLSPSETQAAPLPPIFRIAAPCSAASAAPPRKPAPRRPCTSPARNPPAAPGSGTRPSPAAPGPAAAKLLQSSRQAHDLARHRRPRGLSKGLSGRSPPVFPQRRRTVFFRRRPCRLCIAKPKKPPAAADHFVPPCGCGPVVPRPIDSHRGRDRRGPWARKD